MVIMDMEAGLEHLGRGTTEGMDAVYCGDRTRCKKRTDLQECKTSCKGPGSISGVSVVANKVRNEEDEEFIRSKIPAEDLLGMIHYNPEVMDADRQGKSPYDFSESVTGRRSRID